MVFVFILLLFVSFVLALRSMRDFEASDEVKRYVARKKRGTILFVKGKIKHYSSKFSSSS